MKKYGILILFILLGLTNSQAQKLDMNIGFGSYRVPNQLKFELPRAGFNTNIGLIYQYNDKWTFGTAVNHAVFQYERASLADTPTSVGALFTSATVNSGHLYFIIRRKFNLPLQIEGSIGVGLGGYIEANEYYLAVDFDEERELYTGITWNRDIETGFHLPITYTLRKILANKVHLGIEGGLFLDSKLNTRGIFIGPKAGIFL